MEIRCSILVVEDDNAWQGIYRDLLEAFGYTVETAGSKDDALRRLEQGRFDAFLIDLRLVDAVETNADGLDILNRLFELGVADHAVINSGYMTEEIRTQIIELGAFGIVEKNDQFRLEQLVELVRKATHS
jgi:DNA-binding NtrC family response regulator